MKVTIQPMTSQYGVNEADWESDYMYQVVDTDSYNEPIAGFMDKRLAYIFADVLNGRWGDVV